MTTFIYDSGNLSVKDRLTISNLLGLFRTRMNANWVQADRAPDKTVHLQLLDVDQDVDQDVNQDVNQKDGLQKWEAAAPESRIAVTSDHRSARRPFISRPIRAYGSNGVIVLFNSFAQSQSSRASSADLHREPARMRMTGRLESSAPPPRVAPPQLPPGGATPRTVAPPPAASKPASVRVAVRWGPPEPVSLPPLMQMPGARIHWRQAAQQEDREISQSAPPPAAQPSPKKLWSAPGEAELPPLVNMPTTHRPLEIHAPSAAPIGRANFEKPAPAEARASQTTADLPTLRPSPPQWRAPEPQQVQALIDFRALPHFEVEAVEDLPASTVGQSAAEAVPHATPSVIVPEPEPQTAFVEFEPSLESLSLALSEPAFGAELTGEAVTGDDDAVDWWGTSDDEEDRACPAEASGGSLLIQALKAIKASAQPSILEIPGLPAVCVIPVRNVYFTSAPAARIESTMSARPEVTWRSCDSEEEARRLSGTQQARQASLEQLSWTACLLSPPEDAGAMADRAVRLRRWPPITESRGRSKYIRYATMLSGAQATPRELSEITGDPLQEILSFVNACSQMNLLENSGRAKASLLAAPSLGAPIRTGGAGILRDMIEQLAPPKI